MLFYLRWLAVPRLMTPLIWSCNLTFNQEFVVSSLSLLISLCLHLYWFEVVFIGLLHFRWLFFDFQEFFLCRCRFWPLVTLSLTHWFLSKIWSCVCLTCSFPLDLLLFQKTFIALLHFLTNSFRPTFSFLAFLILPSFFESIQYPFSWTFFKYVKLIFVSFN